MNWKFTYVSSYLLGGWNNQYHEINTPSTATADTIYKSSSTANLQGKSFEHTSEFKTSLQGKVYNNSLTHRYNT